MKIVARPDVTGYAPRDEAWHAVDDDSYCGCGECRCPMGRGPTPTAAIADLLRLMEDEAS